MIAIRHKGGITTLYTQLDKKLVKVGDKVNRGDVIGLSGSTGEALFEHLHFELFYEANNSEKIDPYRDITNPSSLSWWTVDNNPQYP